MPVLSFTAGRGGWAGRVHGSVNEAQIPSPRRGPRLSQLSLLYRLLTPAEIALSPSGCQGRSENTFPES